MVYMYIYLHLHAHNDLHIFITIYNRVLLCTTCGRYDCKARSLTQHVDWNAVFVVLFPHFPLFVQLLAVTYRGGADVLTQTVLLVVHTFVCY